MVLAVVVCSGLSPSALALVVRVPPWFPVARKRPLCIVDPIWPPLGD